MGLKNRSERLKKAELTLLAEISGEIDEIKYLKKRAQNEILTSEQRLGLEYSEFRLSVLSNQLDRVRIQQKNLSSPL